MFYMYLIYSFRNILKNIFTFITDSRKLRFLPNFNQFKLQDSAISMHICPNCNKIYNWKGNLRRHLKLECGKLPNLSCEFCVYVTKHESSLKRHVRFKHRNIQLEKSV